MRIIEEGLCGRTTVFEDELRDGRKGIDIVKSISPDSKILLISPIHLGGKVFLEEYDPEFNEKSVLVSKDLKKKYKDIADQEQIDFLPASDYADPSGEDQEHLSAKGHESLADAIYEKLKAAV